MELTQDVRLAVRHLGNQPGFGAAIVLTLALGIGLGTAVLSVANALLIRPLPVSDQDRVVLIAGETSDHSIDRFPVDIETFHAFAAKSKAFESVAAYAYGAPGPVTVLDDGSGFQVQRALVSGGYFEMLGARPLLGRALTPTDDVLGAAPVLVLSYAAWQRRFGGTPAVLGRSLYIQEDGRSYSVVGVMPKGLDYPVHVEAWVPLGGALTEAVLAATPVNMVGRLRAGATEAEAREEMTAVFQASSSAFVRDAHGNVRPLPQLVSGNVRPAVLAFSAAAALLLLIACANVANLLLLKGLKQVRDVAVRVALGAAKGQIVRQRLVEHLVLAVIGGIGGLVVATIALAAFRAYAPAGLPRLDEVEIDRTLLSAAVIVGGAATLLCGVLPALWVAQVDPQRVLRSDAKQTSNRGSRLLREGLVAVQVALSLTVLSAATLIGRSLVRLQGVDLTLRPAGLMVAQLAFRQDAQSTAQTQVAALQELLERVREMPGVTAVSTSVATPYTEVSWDGRLAPEGQPVEEAARNPLVNLDVVTPDYFQTIGIPVIRGRSFDEGDRQASQAVVVVTQRAAATYWPGLDPVGKRLSQGGGPRRRLLTVVGIVPETRYRDLRDARPGVYFPLAQNFFPFAPSVLLIRTTRTLTDLRTGLNQAVRASGPEIALAGLAPFEDLTSAPLAQPRMNALLLAVFAGAAMALAGIGLAVVLFSTVRQRTKELGVRVALGASGFEVQRLIWVRGMAVAAAGASVGLAGAVALGRLVAGLLFETSPTDPMTLGITSAAVLLAAALASAPAAWSTARIHPMDALRSD